MAAFLFFSTLDRLWIYAAIGMSAGLYLFYRGFRILQRKRLIQNTPTSKIRSASLGLVEINGLATGPYTIAAPVTGRSCFYYRTLAWELRRSGKSEEWQQVVDDSSHVPFFVDDNTGVVLVNPQSAEMELHRDFHQEYSNSMFFGKEMPERVRAFLARHAVSGEHRVRVDEYSIKPKNALFILGTLAENSGLTVSSTPIKTQHASAATFSMNLPGGSIGKLEIGVDKTPGMNLVTAQVKMAKDAAISPPAQEIIQLSQARSGANSTPLTQQGKIAAALIRAGITNPAAWAAAGVSPAASDNASAASGTAVEQFDLQPRVVLQKGDNDRSFFISWRSQREVVATLGWKSAGYIWGGPALTLASMYILLAHFGWL